MAILLTLCIMGKLGPALELASLDIYHRYTQLSAIFYLKLLNIKNM